MTSVVVATPTEIAVLGMLEVLEAFPHSMMSAAQTHAELKHVVTRSGIDLWEFPRTFKDLYYEAKRRSDLKEGEGFLPAGLKWTLRRTLLDIVQQRTAEIAREMATTE